MDENSTGRKWLGIASPGHADLALTLIGFGIQSLIRRDFAPIWQPVPQGVPVRSVLIYLCALVPLVSGLGLFWGRAATAASRLLLAFLLLWFLLLRLPLIGISFTVGVWYSACQTAVILAAALVLYAWFAADRDRQRFGLHSDGFRYDQCVWHGRIHDSRRDSAGFRRQCQFGGFKSRWRCIRSR